MIKQNKNITALPEPSKNILYSGFDTLALSSGSAIFKSNNSGRSGISRPNYCYVNRLNTVPDNKGRDTTEQSAITNQVSVNMPETISDASEAINTLWNEVAPLTETLKGCNIAIPYYEIRQGISLWVQPNPLARNFGGREFPLKIGRTKQFLVPSQKWSMEKLTTSTQNFLHCPNLTTGNLDGKLITNLKKMSHAIMEPDSYFLQNVNKLIHFSQNRALTSIKRNARETTALNQL